MLSSTLTVQPLATIRAPSSSSAKRSSSFRGAKIPAAPMKVRFFLCVCCARDFEETRMMMMMMMMMMSGGDIICAGDSLSPWAGGDLFEFERYFDIYLFSLRRRYFFAVVVVRARKSERERERERRQTGRASALRFTRTFPREGRSSSFIHSSSCPNFDYLVPPARTQQKTKYFSFFIFFSFAAFQSVDDGTRLKSYFHSNTLQNY